MTYTHTPPHDSRAAVAAALAHYIAPPGKPARKFNLSRAIRAVANGRTVDGYEGEVCREAHTLTGGLSSFDRLTVPLAALTTRDMDTTGSSGYLVGVANRSPIEALKGYSVVADAGIAVVENLQEDVVFPRVVAAGSGGWLAPGDALPDAQPTLGSISATPRLGGAIIKLSHQFMRQGDEAEGFAREHVLRRAGDLIDRAVFSGAGLAAPIGVYRSEGVGSQSGTALDRAGLLAMRELVINGGAREENLRWVADPATQELLSGRAAVADTAAWLWADDGTILGRPAHATPTAGYIDDADAVQPALCVGDFSQARLMFWGPASLQISVDRFNSFETGGVAVRVLVLADFALAVPAAFARALEVS